MEQRGGVGVPRGLRLHALAFGLHFTIEYLRGDPRMAVGPFSISQTISIGLLVLGLACLLYARHRQRTATQSR